MKITIDIIDLENQKIKEVIEGSLELTNDSLRVKLEFYSEEMNEALGTWDEPEYSCVHGWALRKHITGVIREWRPESEAWLIKIYSTDSSPYNLYFKKKKRAEEIRQLIETWILNGCQEESLQLQVTDK